MPKNTNAWLWIPTLYFASGLPYHAITSISDIMYKDMGIDNATIAMYTSILLIPWTIKPLWSPFVEMISTRRKWTLYSQIALAICFSIVAVSIPSGNFLPLTLCAFMAGAFVSSTHDIALDGFYILGLTQENVAFDLDCSLNTYTKFERGETNIPFTRLAQIAKYFNVNVAELVRESGEPDIRNIAAEILEIKRDIQAIKNLLER
jgi:DNA-binding XRE family transcriptional regulator